MGLNLFVSYSIWKYLRKVSVSSNTTIIITTHYIEEARLADKVNIVHSYNMED